MKLRTEWHMLRQRFETALHSAKLHAFEGFAGSGQDDLEWVIVYRTADGFCCLYQGLPVNFADMLDVQIWTDEMEVRPYFIGL